MHRVFVSKLARPYAFQSPVLGAEYAAWVLSYDRTQATAERGKITAELVALDAVTSSARVRIIEMGRYS
jgi:hypothetical protein